MRYRPPNPINPANVLGAIKVWPGMAGARGEVGATANLDSPCARRPAETMGWGEGTGFQVEQRNCEEGRKEERPERKKVQSQPPVPLTQPPTIKELSLTLSDDPLTAAVLAGTLAPWCSVVAASCRQHSTWRTHRRYLKKICSRFLKPAIVLVPVKAKP